MTRWIWPKFDAFGRVLLDLVKRRLSYLQYGKRIYRILPDALRTKFWGILLFTLIRAVFESATIFVIAMFARSVASPDSLRNGRVYLWVSNFIPDAVREGLRSDRTIIIVMCCLVVLFIAGKNLIACITTILMSGFSERMGLFLTREMYSKYLQHDYLWHFTPEFRDVTSRMKQRSSLMTLFTSLTGILSGLTRAMVMFAVLLGMNFWLTLTLIVVFAAMSNGMYGLLRGRLEEHGKSLADIDARRNWALRMADSQIREIILYRKQGVFLEQILGTIHEAMPHRAFLAVSGRIPRWILETTGFLSILGAMTYLILRNTPMPMIVASISLLLLTAWRVLPLVSGIMGTAVQIRGIETKAISCLELLESFGSGDAERGESADNAIGSIESIELQNACFRYPQGKKDTLVDITLSIRGGEQVGIIGKSGAGKTTLAMMLSGLLKPSRGMMLVNGQMLDGAGFEAYGRHVGLVPQNPLILSGTLLDNVAFADWGGEYDGERAGRACAMASMDFLLKGKKTTLETVVGEGGSGLSGGEAQRLSIARALYAEPDIMVFDEATSSLDHENESRISNAVASLHGKITCIIIAHRLSTVEHCDKIIWMDRGRVKKTGNPAEILAEYARSTTSKPA